MMIEFWVFCLIAALLLAGGGWMLGVRRSFAIVALGLAFGMVAEWVVEPSAPTATVTSTTVKPTPPTSTPVTIAATTTTTTTTTVAHATGEWRCPKYEALFAQYGLVPVETFSYIAYRESRCRKKAINAIWDENGNMIWALNKNGSYDSGLLQINSTWKTVTKQICKGGIEKLMELDCNLRVAKYLLDNGGLGHWGMGD